MIRKTTKAILMLVVLFTSSCQRDELSTSGKTIFADAKAPGLTSASIISDPSCQDGVYWGSNVTFNSSQIRSFISIKNSTPQEVGYQIPNTAFQGLPNANAAENQTILIPLPSVACQPLLFDHLTFNWDPMGHDPQGVYSVPHFDFHMYTISVARRLAININDNFILVPPDPGYMPSGYYGPIGPLSALGSHWVDTTAPEFNGGTFTKTFVYGSYNGEVIFEEPMVTLEYLGSSILADVVPIRQPAQYQRNGYYPTDYRIIKDSKYTTVSLTGFIYRTASLPTY